MADSITTVLQLKSLPWLSILLLLLTYSIFGWLFSQLLPEWIEWCLEQRLWFGIRLTAIEVEIILKVGGVISVLLLSLILTTPLALLNLIFGDWLRSDAKALLSVLGSSFAVVLVICWLTFFVRLLVLLSAAILVRFELQSAGYPKWGCQLAVGFLCTVAFLVGLALY